VNTWAGLKPKLPSFYQQHCTSPPEHREVHLIVSLFANVEQKFRMFTNP